jgi:hypothetical protein
MTWKNKVGELAYREGSYPIGSFFKSDIIMAAKMMSKDVYNNVDYQFHKQGEDLGWAKNATEKGFKLYSASYIYAPHLMSKDMYQHYLTNGDNRGNIRTSQVR